MKTCLSTEETSSNDSLKVLSAPTNSCREAQIFPQIFNLMGQMVPASVSAV